MNKKKGKKRIFALKLDLEKAYDRLEWPFIEYCLWTFNFSKNTIKLIMSCVASSHTSIQVNGQRVRELNLLFISVALGKGIPSPFIYSSSVLNTFKERFMRLVPLKIGFLLKLEEGKLKFLTIFLLMIFLCLVKQVWIILTLLNSF